jgi:hypothetical protein
MKNQSVGDVNDYIKSARFYDPVLPGEPAGRASYLARFWQKAAGSDLVFSDPDNGML